MTSAPTDEALKQKPLNEEMGELVSTLLAQFDISEEDIQNLTAVEIKVSQDDESEELDFALTILPDRKTAEVGFPYEGDIHYMNFRFVNGKLEIASRETNGFQPCPPEREEWFRNTLEIAGSHNPNAQVAFRFFSEEPQALRF